MPTETFTISRRLGWEFKGNLSVTIECDPLASQPIKLGLAVRVAVSTGANLTGADLTGAKVRDEEITRLVASLNRLIDPYTFYAFELADGGMKILAGCRWFTLAEFRAHIAAEYPDTDKATETSHILDFVAARAAALGVETGSQTVEA